MPAFEYSAQNLLELERTLSADRLDPYKDAVNGDRQQTIRLYEQNVLLAESLYGILQGLEVALRNCIHATLTDALGTSAWYDAAPLQPEQAAMLKRAKHTLEGERKPLDPGRVVAELAFGFWTGLTSAKYDMLWRDHLVKIVPRRSVQRVQVHDRLNSIRKLRNRVAHHEPILARPLRKDANQIFDTLAWISPVTARWVRTNSSFDARLATYQALFPAMVAVGRP